ncbi:hypothetical protein [Stutzerimonas stutzeri]
MSLRYTTRWAESMAVR